MQRVNGNVRRCRKCQKKMADSRKICLTCKKQEEYYKVNQHRGRIGGISSRIRP
jgi:predicted amidophosphoribosyltransferase